MPVAPAAPLAPDPDDSPPERLPESLQWRWLQPQDLQAMYALHLRSIAGMAPAAVKPETPAFMQGLLQGRGRVIGGWHAGALVAYGVLQHDLAAHDDPAALLGLAPAHPLRKLAGAAVDHAWRGHRLQRHLIQRRMACADGVALFATAAPCNPPSWHNLLACGFSVRALEYRYGGHARYLLAHVPQAPWRGAQALARESGPDELALQQTLLAQGWRGTAAGRAPGSLRLVPPEGCTP